MATQKFQLLLVDANIIIKLHELEIWEEFIKQCKVTVTETVAYDEAHFWIDQNEVRHDFDLSQEIENKKISCESVPLDQAEDFQRNFDSTYAIHAGEAEPLALLFASEENWLICSSDGIVFRVLGRTERADQGISLEELLYQIGLGRKLERQYTKKFREQFTQKGQEDSIRERGMT